MNLLERLKQLEVILAPAPWEHIHICPGIEIVKFGQQTEFDDSRAGTHLTDQLCAEFLVEIREALPKLLDVLEAAKACVSYETDRARLRQALAALEEGV